MASNAQRRIKHVSYAKYGYFFIIPFFLVYFIFSFYPLVNTMRYSVEKNLSKEATIYDGEFVGLDNYKHILTSPDKNAEDYYVHAGMREGFLRALSNTFKIWVMNFFPQMILSMILAVWFTDAKLKIPAKGFFKVVMYMPNIITAASVAVLALKMFSNDRFSIVNNTLLNWGLIDEPIQFLADMKLKRTIIAGIQIWMWFGNTMILLMSGIAGINPSLFEAANIDGANSRQVFFRVTVPLLRPILLFTLVTSLIGGMQMFDIPYLFNPGTNRSPGTQTIAAFIYQIYMESRIKNTGHSGAASVVLFIITAALGSIVFYINRDKDEIAAKKQLKKLRKQAAKKAHGGLGL